MLLSRRTVLALSAAAALSPARTLADGAAPRLVAPGAAGADGAPTHALTVFGAAKHGPDFTHFDYVNPDAPRGGEIRLTPSSFAGNQNPLRFDTFNMFILRGDAPPELGLCHAGMMVRGLDEPDTVYAHLAKHVVIDGLTYVFTLREGATFSDGTPITAEDVAFSLRTLASDGHPLYARPLDGIDTIETRDRRTVAITFKDTASNRLPPLVATYPVLSKAYYTANDFTAATLDVPVTSGAYVIADYRTNSFVEYHRRAGYWGDATAPGRGQNNFERVRVVFFRDRNVAFEAFKAGEVTFREEFVSRTWATQYDFPAVRNGEVVTEELPDDRPAGAQGWFINTRRPKFADPRTREALNHAFDFEWTNENLFFGLYERTHSFFMNSDMMAEGEPSAAELALLEPFRDSVPEGVFGQAWRAPQTDGSGRDRSNLRRANALLRAAGWRREGDRLVGDSGPFSVEFLYASPTFERVLQPYAERLRTLGVDATLRYVDAAQYQLRMKNFEFDIVGRRFALAPTPSEAIREYFTSASADVEGSYNLAGIRDPVVDHLVDRMLKATTRADMVAAARALDRVLRLGHYWVPNWMKAAHHVAYRATFARPQTKPRYELPVVSTWWSKDA